MAKIGDLTVEVRLSVSDETASQCLRLLEIWMNDDPDRMIECETVNYVDGERRELRVSKWTGTR